MRIAFLCEGDAETHHAFSGIAKYVVDHLRQLGHEVAPFNATPGRIQRLYVAACTFHPDRRVWRTRFRQGRQAFSARSRRIRRAFRPHRDVIDVVLQVGPALEPPEAGRIPFVLLCDWNMALSIRFRDNPYSSCHGMRMEEAREINERHADVYARAAAILTLSDKLRESFVVDYQIPRDRLLTVHAGPNLDAARIPPREPTRDPGRPPTVLFCGKEFHRKGGDLLLEAFRGVRCELPSARLVMMGPREAGVHAPGVEIAGFLDKNDPGQLARLARHYAEADVFCLPTRLDPFPSVVREAMAFGLPCVTSDVWAVPEMVVDGETGFTVPVDNAPLLAERLLRILRDPELGRRMGEAAQRRAGRLFTWPATALRIHERLLAVVAQRRG